LNGSNLGDAICNLLLQLAVFAAFHSCLQADLLEEIWWFRYMTSGSSIDIREVIFIGSASEDYRGMPAEVRQAADARMQVLQNNGRLPAKQRTALSGKLSGIDEIRVLWDGDTYRAYLAIEHKAVIYILDAGIKKSPHGSAIPQTQIDRLIERKKTADRDYTANRATYEADMAERMKRRKAWEEAQRLKPK
jgi:phage-related protein